VQYIGFVAGLPNVSITVTTSGCTINSGIDIGLMSPCDDYHLVDCQGGDGTNSNTLALTGLTVGQQYILIIDIDGGGICNYVITTDPPTGTVPPDQVIPPDFSIAGDQIVCANTTSEYHTISDDFTGQNLTWTYPAGTLINGQVSPYSPGWSNGRSVDITWGTTSGNLCVTTSTFCLGSVTTCIPITVEVPSVTTLPPITICSNEAPYDLPWGQSITSSGNYSTVLSSNQGCDSTVSQTVTVRPPNVHTLPLISLYPGTCVNICGDDFCDFGTFVANCQAANGCDSTLIFTIIPAQVKAEILGGGSITCDTTSVVLNAAVSPGSNIWQNSLGQQLGTGNVLTVTSPGLYFLTVSLVLPTGICSKKDTILIPLDNAPPGLTANGAIFGCDTMPVFVQSSSPVGSVQYSWTGPNGFTSTLQNPQIPSIGNYIVSALNPENGCVNMDTALVTECCHTFAGAMDTTPIMVCNAKDLFVPFLGNQTLSPGDTLYFILYSNPADPLGSTLMIMTMPVFPFIAGLVFENTEYYVAAVAGHLQPNFMFDTIGCFSLSAGTRVKWLPKPTISTIPAPHDVCKGECLDVTFTFTGTPPFEFSFEVSQNSQVVFSQTEISNTLQKTITVCPDLFNPPGTGTVQFQVRSLRDLFCQCSD